MDSLYRTHYPVELIGFEPSEIMTTPDLLVSFVLS
jgi:hypothetical protein